MSREGIESLSTDRMPDPNINGVKLKDLRHYGGRHVITSKDPLESEVWLSEEMSEKDLEDESRRQAVRDTSRHEAAHAQHYQYLEQNDLWDHLETHDDPRHIANAHLEAIANYQGDIDQETDEVYTEKDEFCEEFRKWISFDVEEFNGTVRPSSAHLYGRIVASMEDRSNTELMDRESAKRTTRQSLISNTSVKDLDDVERKAASSLGIPSFTEMVNDEYEEIVSLLGREEYVEGARVRKDSDFIRLHEGLDGALKYAENKADSASRTGDLEDYMSLMATAGAYKAAGLEYDDREIDPVSQLTAEARRMQRNSDFMNPGV